jgi:hypothetical protein
MRTVNFTHQIESGPLDGLSVDVAATYVYDRGEHVETSHPCNGYGSGYYLERLVVYRANTVELVRIDDDIYEQLARVADRVFEHARF